MQLYWLDCGETLFLICNSTYYHESLIRQHKDQLKSNVQCYCFVYGNIWYIIHDTKSAARRESYTSPTVVF